MFSPGVLDGRPESVCKCPQGGKCLFAPELPQSPPLPALSVMEHLSARAGSLYSDSTHFPDSCSSFHNIW